MKVRTVRKHCNGYAPQWVKNPGRKYVLPDDVGANLIASGLVEVDEDDAAPAADEDGDAQ